MSRYQYHTNNNVIIPRTYKTFAGVEAVVREAFAPFRLQMAEAMNELCLDNLIDEGADLYLANWDMLAQALFHPIANAVKFNRRSGDIKVVLKLLRKEQKLDADANDDDNDNEARLCCEIEDEGFGMTPEKIKDILRTEDDFKLDNVHLN